MAPRARALVLGAVALVGVALGLVLRVDSPPEEGDGPAPFQPRNVGMLVGALSSEDPVRRQRAAYALSELPAAALASALPALARALRDEDPYVRDVAGRALAKHGRELAGPAYAALAPEFLALADHPRLATRREAMTLLWSVGPLPEAEAKAAVPVLVPRLADEDAVVRANAAAVLGNLAPHAASAVPALRAALRDPDAGVRQWAASALGLLGAKEARAEIEALRQDPAPLVRAAAEQALRALP